MILITVKLRVSHLHMFIEEMRKALIQLASHKPFTDPDVVKLSQKLDLLLNKYGNLKYNKPLANVAK